MSRLDSAIRRLQAQRACLDAAAQAVAEFPGPVLEFGLGNGRTFDHLRELLPNREIFVFDRQVAAHPDCIPDDEHMILGDVRETIPAMAGRLPARAVLAHCDIGSGDADANRALAAILGPALDRLLGPGAVIVADQEMDVPRWRQLDLPPKVKPGRYFMYRVDGE